MRLEVFTSVIFIFSFFVTPRSFLNTVFHSVTSKKYIIEFQIVTFLYATNLDIQYI